MFLLDLTTRVPTSKLFRLAVATLMVTMSSLGHAEVPSTDPVTPSEAEILVSQVEQVITEFKRNSTCALTHVHPFSETGCHFHLLSLSCAPAPNEARLFAVNKRNADVESLDRDHQGRLEEPKLAKLQQQLLTVHRISSEAALDARDMSMEGCAYE